MDFQQAEKMFVENGLEYNKMLHEQLEIYNDFLIEYNKKVNLTAITEPKQVWLKHFIDSILFAKYVEIPENASIIDVGTGAGFPSVPLKLYRNDIKLTLLDSLNKRIVFLNKLSTKLEINVETFHSRAEDAAKNEKLREKFDFATARAVAAMPALCEYCMGFVKKGGKFVAMKGVNEEILSFKNAASTMGGDKITEIDYMLGGTDGRKIFVIEKISHTPIKYPRNSGQIKNKPL
ncbi:MAG: 16S rRNA (guanine(527)-N(7))-methyltransferase RsmG [Oscillospiraceae bacterium]|nr:16S rRNA (guanine(527)-N(7))-methyltransferase RsmG [Oscillospiraceae bacterium]